MDWLKSRRKRQEIEDLTLDPNAAVSPAPEPTLVDKPDASLGGQLVMLGKYLLRTDVHTYAFSVAANAILSLFPFIVLLLSLSRNVFHSPRMQAVVEDMFRYVLPVGQDFVVRNMLVLVRAHKGTAFFSLGMLVISSSGIFMPLEVALNQVWRAPRNRSYFHNMAVSLGLAFLTGVLALASVALTTGQQSTVDKVLENHPGMQFISGTYWVLIPCAALLSILSFFFIYWILPNRRVPARAVMMTAIFTGLAWEVMKRLYMHALPWLDLQSVYGPFSISVSLMMWAFLTGLLLLAGAHFSANREALRQARRADLERIARQEAENN
ncbi:MAG: YihY/virulence factor BrkB family protein [Terriglobales bacterium]